jgi:signal transduction histidine kinase
MIDETADRSAEASADTAAGTPADSVADIAIDGRGIVCAWPPAAVKLFGYERTRALGSSFDELLLPTRLKGVELPRGVELDVPVTHQDGHELRVALSRHRSGHGDAVHFRPLTTRTPPDVELYLEATADPDLPERHRLLTELSQLRTEFIRVASHELRTPLTSIITFATMLEAGDDVVALDPADRQSALGVIRRNAERMQLLVADLLLLSQLETAETPLDLAPVALASLLDFPGVPVRVGTGPVLPGDATLLHQLFHTAVHIAAIAGPARVDASYVNGRWTVLVSVSSGSGLTAERLLSMRIPHPEHPGEHRTGALALMLGREIAARHGGSMVTSVDRPGLTVRIILPAV